MDMSHYFNNGEMSDVTLRFGDRELKCHKFILATRSEYFKNLLTDSNFKESKQDIVELKDDDPDALSLAIQWIYSLGCDFHFDIMVNKLGWKVLLQIMVVADKYLLPDLKSSAFGMLEGKFDTITKCFQIDEMVAVMKTCPELYAVDHRLERLVNHMLDHNVRKLVDNSKLEAVLCYESNILWGMLKRSAKTTDMTEALESQLGLKRTGVFLCSDCKNVVGDSKLTVAQCHHCGKRLGRVGATFAKVCWVKI